MGCSGSRAEILDIAPDPGPTPPYNKTSDGAYSTTDGKACVTIRTASAGIAGIDSNDGGTPLMTIGEMFSAVCKKKGEKIALSVERPCPAMTADKKAPPVLPLDQWKKWTYQEYYDETYAAGKAMIELGLKRHDAVNVYGFNSPEWFMAELGCILAGGKAAGIYPSDTEDQVCFKSKHSGAVIAAVQGEAEYKKFAKRLDELPKLKAIVCWSFDVADGTTLKRTDGSEVKVMTWDALVKLGKGASDEAINAALAEQKPGHCCALIYTSGTTGDPKAVMISHDNIIFESHVAIASIENVGRKAEQERVLSYLPLSHVAGMMIDIISPITASYFMPSWFTVYFARAYDLKIGSVGDRLRAVKPTLFLGVPRVWEKIAEKMKAIGAAMPDGTKKKIAGWAKRKGLEHQRNCQLGGSGEKPPYYAIAEKLILSKVKAALGLECCKFGFTGAAPITTDTLEYFGQLGIQINEVYGMSECTGATTWSTDKCHVWGSCGYTVPGCEVKILNASNSEECPLTQDIFNATEAEQGEICFRGRHIMMGYMANPDLGADHVALIKKKTADAIDEDGWLHSGDKGCKGTNGMVKITGRYKELIIGAGGENIAPVPIEDNLKKVLPAVSNVMMVGDKRKYNVAVITLKCEGATGDLAGTDVLTAEAKKANVNTIAEACADADYAKHLLDGFVATNKNGECCPSNASKIQKFTILPRDFAVETGELTPTLKLKRSVVEKKYHARVEAMYASKESGFVDTSALSTEDIAIEVSN